MKFLFALMLASSAAAQPAPPIIYMDDHPLGSLVDVNQGWYVCKSQDTTDLLSSLLNLSQPLERRWAARRGCEYRISDREGPRYTVVRIVGSICRQQRLAYEIGRRGQRLPRINCGKEGHELIVEYQGHQLTVMQINRESDFE